MSVPKKWSKFLGCIVENGTIPPSSKKVKTVQDFPESKTIKEESTLHVLQKKESFVEHAKYFHKFILDMCQSPDR